MNTVRRPRRPALTAVDWTPPGYQDRLRAGRYSLEDLQAQAFTIRFWLAVEAVQRGVRS